MDQTTARRRAKALNESGEYDTIFVAMTESHLRGQFDTHEANWVVVERTPSGSTLRIVEE